MKALDIWLGVLQTDNKTLQKYACFLDANERSKADNLKNPLIRERFIAVRGLLRSTMAKYLAVEPAALQFAVAEHGKPFLPGQSWYFNLSHSENYIALAVAETDSIGIDVERIKFRPCLQDIAKRCFSEKEFTAWNNLPAFHQQRAFYRLWTIKEAFVKAVGRGIALGLENCELEMPDGQRFLNLPADYGQPEDWRVIELMPDDNFCGAVVTPNIDFKVRQFSFEDSAGTVANRRCARD